MIDDEDRSHQLELLNIHRKNLQYLLEQAAMFGGEKHVPLQTANTIRENRLQVERIKRALRANGVEVKDKPEDTPDSSPPKPPLSKEESHALGNRRAMLNKVKAIWIGGFLENSLADVVRLDLGLATQPDAVLIPFNIQIQERNLPPRQMPKGTSIVNVYDQFAGELLILGSPGSGKTTLLLELTRTLLERAEQDDTIAIPVVFNLSSWAQTRSPIVEWLEIELHERYDVPVQVARQWIEEDQILPLLDGLDEVARASREQCVLAINDYRSQRGFAPMVVCSRSVDYQELGKKLRLIGAVSVQPLTKEQIVEYTKTSERLAPLVKRLLDEDATSYELLSTPLFLSIAVLVDLHNPHALERDNSLSRTGLLEAYVQGMLDRRQHLLKYSKEKTLKWLGWLSTTMRKKEQTVLHLEWIQPDWLPNKALQYSIT